MSIPNRRRIFWPVMQPEQVAMTDPMHQYAILLVNRFRFAPKCYNAYLVTALCVLFGERGREQFGAALDDWRVNNAEVEDAHQEARKSIKVRTRVVSLPSAANAGRRKLAFRDLIEYRQHVIDGYVLNAGHRG